MPDPRIVEYLRKHRGEFSDAQLREALLGQGLASEDIDAAFKLVAGAKPAPESPPKPAPAAAAPKRKSKVPAIAVVSVLVGAVCALGAFWLLKVRKAAAPGGEAFREELQDYVPEPLAWPKHLAVFLPKLADGDAGEEYFKILSLVRSKLKSNAKFDQGDVDLQMKLIEAAAAKKSMALYGTRWTPQSIEELREYSNITDSVYKDWTKYYKGKIQFFLKEKKPERVQVELMKFLVLGAHLMQDWDINAQSIGLNMVAAATQVLIKFRNTEALSEERRAAAFLILELQAYGPDLKEIDAINAAARDRKQIAGLVRYAQEERLRRPYLSFALLRAALSWTEDEALKAVPWEERGALFAAVAGHSDPRVSALGAGYAKMFLELRNDYAAQKPQDRKTLHERYEKSFGAGAEKR